MNQAATPHYETRERIIDQRLRDIVTISDGQFGFKSGVGTTDAIFVIRTLCDK